MIEVSGLTFGYARRAEPIIDGLTHRFAVGAMTAVTGVSGRGKSTLLYLLGLMLTPWSGTVTIDGAPVSGLSDGARSALRARRTGFVFQDAVLDPSRSVLDNVLEGALYAGLGAQASRRDAGDLLATAGVEGRHAHLPGQISGGQAQRVALCRALIKNPSIILADEPTGNLDPASAHAVWAMLRARADDGVTVIVASHDPARIADCDVSIDLATA